MCEMLLEDYIHVWNVVRGLRKETGEQVRDILKVRLICLFILVE